VIESFIPITNMIVFRVRERRQVVAFHQRIHEALSNRDVGEATAALTNLLAYVRDSYSAALDARSRRAGEQAQS